MADKTANPITKLLGLHESAISKLPMSDGGMVNKEPINDISLSETKSNIFGLATVETQGIGLGIPHMPYKDNKPKDHQPPITNSNFDLFQLQLDQMLAPTQSLDRAVRELGLHEIIRRLVHKFDRETVLAALATKGRPPKSNNYYTLRHTLVVICERYGCKGDRAAAAELRRFFPDKYGKLRTNDAMYRLLREARRRCTAEPNLKASAEHLAGVYLEGNHGDNLQSVLRNIIRRWTKTTAF